MGKGQGWELAHDMGDITCVCNTCVLQSQFSKFTLRDKYSLLYRTYPKQFLVL